jgi:hypothetical protein
LYRQSTTGKKLKKWETIVLAVTLFFFFLVLIPDDPVQA